MTITKKYAEYVTCLQYDNIPPDVIDYAKRLILDAIGISIGAKQHAASSKSFIASVKSLASAGDATVFATGEAIEPQYAAMLNGALIHSLDYDDTHRGASLHPGAPVIAAAIAFAESVDRDVSGQELLTAIIAGYEVTCRIGKAVNPQSHYKRGFHVTATCGTFGATAAAAKVAGIDGESLEHAFGLNGSQAAGSQQYVENGSWNKRIHPGLAAHAGIIAVTFAEAGFYGSKRAIEGKNGFLEAYSDNPHPEQATNGLGEHFELHRTAIKPYPCCRYMHAPLDALFELLEMTSLTAKQIDNINVELVEPGVDLIGIPIERKRNPKSFVDAQFSMPFCAALAIIDGEVTVDALLKRTASAYSDELDRLMQATEVGTSGRVSTAYPNKWPAYVTIESDGERFDSSVEYARGEPENPISWDDTVEKYERLTSHIPSTIQGNVLTAIRSLEKIEVRELTEELRVMSPDTA